MVDLGWNFCMNSCESLVRLDCAPHDAVATADVGVLLGVREATENAETICAAVKLVDPIVKTCLVWLSSEEYSVECCGVFFVCEVAVNEFWREEEAVADSCAGVLAVN